MKYILLFSFLFLMSCSNKSKSKVIFTAAEDKEYLITVLDTIWKTEQTPIRLRDSLGKIYGFDSDEFLKQQDIVHKSHNINEEKIIDMLNTYGWIGEDIIGEQGSLTICNVIQHSDNEIRLRYLPMMRKAVRDKKLQPRLLARAEDRIATEAGKPQIYGGQVKYYPETKSFDVWPIKDPKNVDKRRVEIGLVPIAEFLKNFRTPLEWNLEEQIRRTAEFESKQKL